MSKIFDVTVTEKVESHFRVEARSGQEAAARVAMFRGAGVMDGDPVCVSNTVLDSRIGQAKVVVAEGQDALPLG